MYLHLGQNTIVPEKTVIGIFDMDNTTGSRNTRNFLSNAERDGNVINVSDDLPKSFIVCHDKNKTIVYLSQLASQTLQKRAGPILFERV